MPARRTRTRSTRRAHRSARKVAKRPGPSQLGQFRSLQCNAVQFKTKDNNKWYAVMNATKDALKSAPGFRIAMAWIPDGAATTTGGPRPAKRQR
jgi:hypothetical protein